MRAFIGVSLILLAGCTPSAPMEASRPNSTPLITPEMIVGDALPAALTDTAGNPETGQKLFIDRDAGHCVMCHAIEGLEVEFQGNAGPDLTYVGARLSLAQIRLRIVDYQQVQAGILMPSYYRRHDLYQVAEDYRGEPILTAQTVEDIAAFLAEQNELDP